MRHLTSKLLESMMVDSMRPQLRPFSCAMRPLQSPAIDDQPDSVRAADSPSAALAEACQHLTESERRLETCRSVNLSLKQTLCFLQALGEREDEFREAHPQARIDEVVATRIEKMLREGLCHRDVASAVGCRKLTVDKISERKHWRYVS
jgi:hypothetical protein